MNTIILKAPAKINLFLKVLARRPDGYHEIETLFEKIALFDKIELQKKAGGVRVDSSQKGLPEERENLAYRAAILAEERCKKSLGVNIKIEKSIPIGAGLGGGSSDAAAVLIGINRLYDIGLSVEELKSMAGELGADVPFFISGKTWAVGRERGDRVEPIDVATRLWHILVVPSFSILSKDAYEWVDRKRRKRNGAEIDDTLSALKENDIESLGKNLYNDLEGIAFERLKDLKEFKDRLVEYGAKGALVSGSGPALFGIAKDEEEVMRLRGKIEDEVLAKDERWRVLTMPTLYNE